ncbi:mitochondrial carrier protein [Nemania sp. FL0916]|nr:mitochondrial carrier protein [Nemania sp. FL0916]
MTNLDIIHAYRHLYRGLLHAVQFSSPARYTARNQLRRAFREKGATYDHRGYSRTIRFLDAATRERGLEHQVLKNLLIMAWYRHENLPGWKQVQMTELQKHVKNTVYNHYDATIKMLNKSMGLRSLQNVTAASVRTRTMPQQHSVGKDEPRRWIKRYRTEVAASSASVLSTVTAFPLDSVKTRMQTYPYDGALHCVRATYNAEGMRGFFRGVLAPLASVTLVRTVSFSIYQRSKYIYSDWMAKNIGFCPLEHVNKNGAYPNLGTIACFGAAGATAGSGITLIACPFELTKLSAQVSVLMANQKNVDPKKQAIAMSYHNKGTIKTLSNIVKHRGYTGMYTGLNLHLLRDTLGTGIYFATYESSKQLLTTFSGTDAHKNPIAVLVAGAVCGIVSWALIYPIDSVKSIYQRNALMYSKGQHVPIPKIQFFRRDMYRGLGVSMGRSAAVNAVFFSAFEFFKKRINAVKDM